MARASTTQIGSSQGATTAKAQSAHSEAFRHEALLYAGPEGFLEGTLPFIRDAVAGDEPILVVVSAAKIDMLRDELDGQADRVWFGDMAEIGVNPARIIPAWRQFVSERAVGRRVRGIGEPMWAGRTDAELIECQRHESLLNLAFDGQPAWDLLCPYDTEALSPAVIAEARRSHPYVTDNRGTRRSRGYRGTQLVGRPFDAPLPPPPRSALELAFDTTALDWVRRFVAQQATAFGLDGTRADDLVLAVHELATNSVRYGGGGGTLRVWPEGGALICEVTDGGCIDDPFAGRQRPALAQDGGRGLWLVNQLCELVQVRSFPSGTVVRLHMRGPTGA
jgi:anti-sigma regulatory factor (Ser/Thr protein kinase)